MERRKALKGIAFLAAGSAILPYCKSDVTAIKYNNLPELNSNDHKLIQQLSLAIIPVKGTEMAPPMPSDKFILMSVNDCYSPEDQVKFMKGLSEFTVLANKKGEDFGSLTSADQQSLFESAINDQSSEDLKMFAKTTKDLTLRNVTTSQIFMEKYRAFKMLPGTYVACKSIS
ncbi:MAG TPA: gluconate 2-dehydrogenase subunit 3 family protein [Saprospiraceae bacterium]|nr:gluconate 2-dehydrogenase subunit 3 family protein [Saprospiraceae bacterium]HPN69960.1 gluconate 2-dehydrogenase subunit 3 family protein [Saprospiraceae bacterium]